MRPVSVSYGLSEAPSALGPREATAIRTSQHLDPWTELLMRTPSRSHGRGLARLEHGHSGMFEAAGAGILGVGGFTPNLTDNSVVKVPWGIGQKRMVERKIQHHKAQGWKLVSQH